MRGGMVLASLACGLLAGCGTPGLELQGDVVQLAERSRIASDRKVGAAVSVIRAYQLDEAGKRQEIGGAICTLRSQQFSGRVTTPQIIQYPRTIQAARFKDRGQPSALTVSCRAGALKAAGQVEAVPQIPGGGGTNSYDPNTGISVSTRPLYGRLASSYPWVFPNSIDVVVK